MKKLTIPEKELSFSFIRSPGPGGQKVNKVATGVVLRFNIKASPSIPAATRERLLKALASKITADGELIIKSTSFRQQNQNKQEAIIRLHTLLNRYALPPKQRIQTKPSKAVKQRRHQEKKKRSQVKSQRQFNPHHD